MTELPTLTSAMIDGEDDVLSAWVEDSVMVWAGRDPELMDLRDEIRVQVEALVAISDAGPLLLVIEHLLRCREARLGTLIAQTAFEAGVRSAKAVTP